MSSLKPSRTTLRLLKLASLGLAGLLAGLLVGCNAAPKTTATNSASTSYDAQTESVEPLGTSTSNLPPNLDATSIPAIKHPPSARRLDYGSVRTSHPPAPSHGS